MVKQLLDAIPDPSGEDIRHYLAGNLCRCSAYPEILDAVRIAAKRRADAAQS
jgi:aerobic-type carbon monoxide dehydrogenase small subunit (CoxS/CutS family)